MNDEIGNGGGHCLVFWTTGTLRLSVSARRFPSASWMSGTDRLRHDSRRKCPSPKPSDISWRLRASPENHDGPACHSIVTPLVANLGGCARHGRRRCLWVGGRPEPPVAAVCSSFGWTDRWARWKHGS